MCVARVEKAFFNLFESIRMRSIAGADSHYHSFHKYPFKNVAKNTHATTEEEEEEEIII